jgi:hypothetical protein
MKVSHLENFILLILFCILNFVHVFAIDNSERGPGEACDLRDNQKGICKQIKNCEYAKKLFRENRRSELLHCAFKGRTSYVCCPAQYPKSEKFKNALCKDVVHPASIGINIVGGENAIVGEFPFQVALGYLNLSNMIEYKCGGSLIADDIVLTAAHCAIRKDNKPVTVKLGRASLVLDEYDFGKGEDIEIQVKLILFDRNP